MKKCVKAILCIWLVAALLLAAACGGGGGGGNGSDGVNVTGTVGMGRFMERDISPPIEGQFLSFAASDGTLIAVEVGLSVRYDSSDGGQTWVQAPAFTGDIGQFASIQMATLLPCGSLLAQLFRGGEGIIKIDPSGNITDFHIASIDDILTDDDMIMFSLLQRLGDDRLLVSYTIHGFAPAVIDEDEDENENDDTTRIRTFGGTNSRFEQRTALLDLNGNLIAELPFENISAAVAHGDYFYVLSPWESTINRVYMENGALTSQPTISLAAEGGMGGVRMMGIGIEGSLAVNNDGNLLVLHGGNLLLFENGRSDTMLDGNAFSFGAPNNFVSSMIVLACGNIAMVVSDGITTYLFKYEWDENAVVSLSRTLSIWSLEDNDTVRAAIMELRRRYPDAYITYEVALTSGGAISAADAIRSLNTRLLSGRGPDILILDGVPIDGYAGRGMLLDLTGQVNTEGMFKNLLAPYLTGGQTYVIPTQFSIPVLMGSEQALAESQTLAALIENIVTGNPIPDMQEGRMLGGIPEDERATIAFDSLEELFNFMWYTNASAFLQDNRLEANMLREFLGVIQAISDKYQLAAEDDMDAMSGVFMAVHSGGGSRTNAITGSLMQFMMQSTNLAAFTVDNIMMLQMMTAREDAEIAIFPGLAPGAWLPSTIVGVSADTEVEAFSIEFVNTMLSLQVQQMNHGMGLPVTHAAIQEQINQINRQLAEFEMEPFDIDVGALVGQLQTPALIETTLHEMIWVTVERLCTGRIDLEGAVQEVEQNIRNYLAERS
ncbi:MAG: ABC transporter substrate-binding protein [Defluviitaleaceae bacterium]|nr:ABC transporter substrate-binding protein [Defluviitaleaceae bacterium]